MIRLVSRSIMMIVGLGFCLSLYPQKKNFSYDFYGFVRGELFYNSRKSMEGFDGMFYLYPFDKSLDANGKDLNAVPDGSFYMFATRVGMNIQGPNIGSAQSTARVEADFAGASGILYLLRIRHAFTKLTWKSGSSVLMGQTWHPFFGDFCPEIINISTGAPFQPFNRSPMLQYQYKKNRFQLKASAVYQLMYLSAGPSGRTKDYIKNSTVPELCLNLDYIHQGFQAGVGVEMLSLKPRLQSVVNEKTFRVDERITTFSYEAHAIYKTSRLLLSSKALLTSNLTHMNMLSGYGVHEQDAITGEQTYTPFQHATVWVNALYGTKWQVGCFAGYTKNLGSSKSLLGKDKIYGLGTEIDQLLTGSAQLTYNLPNWKMGMEYQLSTAWYGDMNLSNGKIRNTHDVMNHRIMGLFMYLF